MLGQFPLKNMFVTPLITTYYLITEDRWTGEQRGFAYYQNYQKTNFSNVVVEALSNVVHNQVPNLTLPCTETSRPVLCRCSIKPRAPKYNICAVVCPCGSNKFRIIWRFGGNILNCRKCPATVDFDLRRAP